MFDLSIGDAIQGGCGAIALYLALQIKNTLSNHETRITTLETGRATPRNRKRPSRPRK